MDRTRRKVSFRRFFRSLFFSLKAGRNWVGKRVVLVNFPCFSSLCFGHLCSVNILDPVRPPFGLMSSKPFPGSTTFPASELDPRSVSLRRPVRSMYAPDLRGSRISRNSSGFGSRPFLILPCMGWPSSRSPSGSRACESPQRRLLRESESQEERDRRYAEMLQRQFQEEGRAAASVTAIRGGGGNWLRCVVLRRGF